MRRRWRDGWAQRVDWPHLARLLHGNRRQVATLSTASVVAGLAEAGFLVLVARIALAVADGRDDQELLGRSVGVPALLGAAAALLVVRAALGFWSAAMSARLSTSVALALRSRLAAAFLRASWRTKQAERPGRLQELLGSFVAQVMNLVGLLATSISTALNLAAMMVVALVVDPRATIVVSVVLVALNAVISPFRSRVRALNRSAATSGLDYSTTVSELGALGLEMEVFGVRAAMEARLDALSRAQMEVSRRAATIRGVVPVLYITVAYAGAALALALIAVVGRGQLASVGAVLVVMLRALTYGQALQVSAVSIANATPTLGLLHDALDRYEADRASGGEVAPRRVGDVELRGVGFSYDGRSQVLSDVHLTIAEGEVLGLIGPSGAGKSTLVQLLLGLREPTTGSITAGGVELRAIDRAAWSSKVAFVPQQAQLFSGTVAENIAFFRPDITEGAIVEAARAANVHDDIVAMPQGYATPVGERGGRLSGGQQQRLSIARALVGRPELLICDEPTSALDPRSEALIRDTLAALGHHVTVVVVAHRLSTLSICDRIGVVQDGRLVACDRPEVLQAATGFYQEALRHSGIS